MDSYKLESEEDGGHNEMQKVITRIAKDKIVFTTKNRINIPMDVFYGHTGYNKTDDQANNTTNHKYAHC